MIVISNSSPLIALAKIQRLSLLKQLFKNVYIPDSVYQETVVQSHDHAQKNSILQALNDFMIIATPHSAYPFTRTIDQGEQGVLNLALDMHADLLIVDDKKARNEAKELGFRVIKTSTLLKRAEQLGLIDSYIDVSKTLAQRRIYLP